MSSAPALSAARIDDRADFEYRPINATAIAAAVFGVISAVTVFAARDSIESAMLAAPIPLLGIALGLRAIFQMRANPDMSKGRWAAIAGIALSLTFLTAGLAFASYVHATEVPDGYTRTSFVDFKPTEADIRGNRIIPPEIAALDGQKVFIKGYYRPDSSPITTNVKQFLLVRDNNQCCFGDLSTVQFYDQVAVHMAGKLTVDYRQGLYRLGGKLYIKPDNAVNGSGLPVYVLDADYVK